MPQVGAFLATVGKIVTFGKVAGATALAVIGATTIVGASFAVSRLLRPKMDMDIGDSDGSRQRTVRSTIEPQKLVYGETMVSGPLTYAQCSGDNNRYLHQVIALAGHELTEIKEVYFDDKSIDLTDSNIYNSSTKHVISGFFGPKDNENGVSETIVYIDTRLGAATQTAYAGLRSDTTTQSEYLATHRGDGIASLYTKWTLHEGSREVWDEVGAVQSIKAVVKGKKVYDPRLDVDAGNTAGDNPTNASYVVYSDNSLSTGSAVGNYDRSNQGQNPALILADYLMDSRFGLGIPSSKIDWSAVVAAADHCDQLVPIPTSATQKRFFGSGVIFGGDKHRRSIEKILSAMNGTLVYTSGKYVIRAGVYFAVSETLTESDVIGPVQVQTSIPRSDRFNQVKGLFIDPNENYKMMEFGPVTIGANDFNSQSVGAIARDNGEVLTQEIKLPFTSNRYAAQRVALLQVAQSYHQTVVTVPVNLKGMRIAIGDRVNLTIDALNEVDSGSWSPKIFKCIGWSFSESDSGGIDLTLIEDFSASYNNPQESDYSTITAAGVISTGLPDVPSPTTFTATAGINRVELNWTNPPNTGAWEQIWVYASDSSTTPTDSSTPIAKFRGTSFTHLLDGGTNNYYWIQAVRYPNGTTPGSGQTNAAKSAFIPANPTNVTANKITSTVIGDGEVDTLQIANDAIDSDKIDTIQSSNYSASAGSEAGWKIDQDGSAEFNNVVVRGNVNATTGTIGGLTVGSSKLYVGDGDFNDPDTEFYVDDQGQLSLKDKLKWDGTDLTVSGAVNASSGDFSGQVAVGSTAGTITVIDGNDTDYRMFTNATLDTDTNQYLPDDSSFKVGNDGRVFASNITIYNDDGDVLLSPTGLGAAALNDISSTSGQVVSTVGGTVSNSTSEITLTTSSASESFTITSKVAINDNFDGTQYFSGASTSSTANAEAQLTGVDVLIDYYVKADGGSYGASPDVTKTVTIVNSGTPTSTQMRVGGFDRGSSYSGSLTRYFALLQDFGGALEIIPNSGGGASSYVVTTASLGSSLFPSAQTYKIKIVMRVVEDGTTTVISGSTTPPSSDNTTTGIYFDGGNSDERHYEITGTGLIKNSDNTFTSGSQNLLSSGGTISGNLTVTGDFTVQGTTTTLDTATLNVEDRNITLNYSTGDSSGSADGAGITIQDAVNSSTDATLNWNATNDRWEFSHQMKTPSLMVGAKERIDVDGDLNNIRNANISGTITSVGTTDASFAGGATFAGDVTVQGLGVGSYNSNYDFYNNGTSYLNGAVTIDDNLTVHPTNGIVIFNEPSTDTDLQTVARFGTAARGVYITSDTALITSGSYYDGGWVAKETFGAMANFGYNSGGFEIEGFTGATVDSAPSWVSLFRITSGGNVAFNGSLTTTSGTQTVADLYSGLSQAEVNIGRNASERLNFTVQDEQAYIRYYQDETGSQNHSVNFQINSSSSGANIFTFNKGVSVTGAITSSGQITAKSAVLTDDGSGSPLLKISADDNAPWAIQLYREDLGGGPQVFASNTTTWSFQGHINLRPTYAYKIDDTTVIDSSRNLTNIGTISSGAITSSGLVTGNGGVLGDPYLQTKGAAGAIAVYIDSKSSFDGTNTLNAPMIEWRESDGTNIAGIRGYVDTGGNKLALGTGFFDEEVTITSSGMEVAGTVTWSGMSSSYVQHALNLNSIDDRDIAPEDLSYSDDLRFFFAEKNRVEGGSSGSTYLDFIYLNSYSDSSGGDANALAFHKGTKRIYHYQADQAATNWGTAKSLAYTDDNISGTAAGLSGTPNISVGSITTTSSITVDPASGDAVLFLQSPSQTMRMDQNSLRTTTNSNFSLFTNGNNPQLVLVQATGHVGVGVSDPDVKFMVKDDSTWDTTWFESDSATGAGFSINATDIGVRWSLIAQGTGGGAGDNKLGFHLTAAGSSGEGTGYKAALEPAGGLTLGNASSVYTATNRPSLELCGYSESIFALKDDNNGGTANDAKFYIHNNRAASLITHWSKNGYDQRWYIDDAEFMRLKDTNFFVGKVSDNDNTAGHKLQKDGLAVHTRSGNFAAIFNRTSDDGDVVQFKQDGALVGKITTRQDSIMINDRGLTNGDWMVLGSNISVDVSGQKIHKHGDSNSWNGHVYSSFAYKQGACARLVPSFGSGKYVMFGLNADPTTGSDYTSIDYAMYVHTTGNLYVYESGSSQGLIGSYAAGDDLRVVYNGYYILYLHNGTVLRRVSVGSGLQLYFDSSFYSLGSYTEQISYTQNQPALDHTGSNISIKQIKDQASQYTLIDNAGTYLKLNDPSGGTKLLLGNNNQNYYDSNDHIFRNGGGSSTGANFNSNGTLSIQFGENDTYSSASVASLRMKRSGSNYPYMTFHKVDGTRNGYLQIGDHGAYLEISNPSNSYGINLLSIGGSHVVTQGAQYGSMKIDGDGANGYAGLNIDNRLVLMHNDQSTPSQWTGGIFNDEDNQWFITFGQGGAVNLTYNGTNYISTYGAGLRYEHNEAMSTGGFVGRHGLGSPSASTDLYPNPVYSIGPAYRPSGTGLSSCYGFGYSHGNSSWFLGSGWGFWVAADGDNRVCLDAQNGTVIATGNITAYASDRRLKTNIHCIESPIQKLKQIRGVEYDWVENIESEYEFTPTEMHEVGVIAQEIQSVLPSVVRTAPFNKAYTRKTGWRKVQKRLEVELGREVSKKEAVDAFDALSKDEQNALTEDHEFLTVDYERITPLLIEAVKEQQTVIEELMTQLEEIKKRLDK